MKAKIVRRRIDGVLLLDKPHGMSSNHALQAAKRLLSAEKAGHTGTLDPMATGLLPLTFGEATKFSQMLLDADKVYEAQVCLGAVTTTGDVEGEVIERQPVHVGAEALAAALRAFVGVIEQVPPMYSALKLAGRPLYEYARAGLEVERAPRRVTIHALELIAPLSDGVFGIRVHCSKGTYIRTLAMDIGARLGCGAHLVGLRRTRIGAFGIERAVTLPQLELAELGERDGCLLGPDALVVDFPALMLDAEQTASILQGRTLASSAQVPAGLVRLYGGARFIGLGECRPDGGVSPKRLVATG